MMKIMYPHVLGISPELIHPQETVSACAIQNYWLVLFMNIVDLLESFNLFPNHILHSE